MSSFRNLALGLTAVLALPLVSKTAQAVELQVSFTNLAPAQGFFFTPVYTAFHNGTFDGFDVGGTASAGLQSIAEDGDFAGIRDERIAASPGSQGLVLFGGGIPPVAPGETTTSVIDITDPVLNRFFFAASMLIPSQDAFIGTDNAVELFDALGNFNGDLSIDFLSVYDAGTEDNADNSAVAFLNQTAPNTGTSENNLIAMHAGLSDDILDSLTVGPGGAFGFSRAAADFTTFNGPVAQLTISLVQQVAEPSSLGLMLAGIGYVGWRRRKIAGQ